MILADLRNLIRYKQIIPYFNELNSFLQINNLHVAEKGKISIIEDELFINVVEIETKKKEEQVMEGHRDYLDIHIPLSGEETIGWKATETCAHETKPYEKENDCVLFSDIPDIYFTLKPSQFAIVYPEDAHAPSIGDGLLKKAIVKIRLTS